MDVKSDWKITAKYKVKKPRKIIVINPSKYEMSNTKHANHTHWRTVLEKVDQANREPSLEKESAEICRVLPEDIYTKVCRTLDLPVTLSSPLADSTKEVPKKKPKYSIKTPMVTYRKYITVERELDSDTDVEASPRPADTNINYTDDIHRDFLRRRVREQVTWKSRYLEPERDDEKSLVKRANDLTDKIAEEFCDYMKQLGGSQQSQLFTPKAIKELFQVEFDTHVARSLRIVSKELPSVPDEVAAATGCTEKSKQSILERKIMSNIAAERKPTKIEAFGCSLPTRQQWSSPENNTRQLWRSAKHIPNDLVTLKTVWDGITNLRSVKEYCRWMIEHPEFRRPPFLESMAMFDATTLNARLTVESARLAPDSAPSPSYCDADAAPIEDIRRRLSLLVDNN